MDIVSKRRSRVGCRRDIGAHNNANEVTGGLMEEPNSAAFSGETCPETQHRQPDFALTAAAPVVEGLFRLCGKRIGLGDGHGGRKDARLATSL
jgi:hypothetical protein